MSKRHTVSVDFDGVLHAYTTPWIAPHVIPDPPVEGAIEWLFKVIQHFDVQILTTRARTFRGRWAIRSWLRKHAGLNLYYDSPAGPGLERVKITAVKHPALIYIDDRAYRFDGKNWPSRTRINLARPWHKPLREVGREEERG